MHAITPHSPQPDRPTEEPRVLLTVEAAAELLSYSRTHVYTMLKTGEIESVKVGRLRRIPTDALVAYVQRLTTKQRAA